METDAHWITALLALNPGFTEKFEAATTDEERERVVKDQLKENMRTVLERNGIDYTEADLEL